MKRRTECFSILLNAFLLIGFGILTANAESNSIAIAKLRGIPPADPKWENTNNLSDPSVPLLTLSERGAFLNGSHKPIPFDQVLSALAALPVKAWGHGRFLIFFPCPPGLHSPVDYAPPDFEVKKVLNALKAAGIKINRSFVTA
jgi:hypothetical protein